jgi:hypothetical protein
MDRVEKLTEELIKMVKECSLYEDGGRMATADIPIDFERLRINFELFLGGYIESNFFSAKFKKFLNE